MTPTHTKALTYSRWERFLFWLTGRWPEAVVERRLEALDKDEQELAAAIAKHRVSE